MTNGVNKRKQTKNYLLIAPWQEASLFLKNIALKKRPKMLLQIKSSRLPLRDWIFHNHIHIKYILIELHFKENKQTPMIVHPDSNLWQTPILNLLKQKSLFNIFMTGSSYHDIIHIYFIILSPFIISHLWDLHFSIMPDIKDNIMKLLHFLSIQEPQKFSYFKNKKNIIIPRIVTLHGWLEIAYLNNDNKI